MANEKPRFELFFPGTEQFKVLDKFLEEYTCYRAYKVSILSILAAPNLPNVS